MIKTIGKVLLALCAVALFAIGAAAVLFAFGQDYVRDGVGTLVTNLARRDFRIDGRLEIEVGRQITLTGTDIRFANAEWGAAPDMVHVDHAKIIVDLPALLGGLLLIEFVDIDGAVIALETSQPGTHNWMLFDQPRAEDADSGPALDFLIHRARIRNLEFSYTHPQQIKPLIINLDLLEQSHAEDNLLVATLRGTANGKRIAIDGHYGPFMNLRTGKDLTFDVAAEFDTLTITGNGLIDDILSPRRPALELKIEGPEIDHITDMLGLSSLGGGTLDLDASLRPTDEQLTANIEGNLGRYNINADGFVSNLSDIDNLDIDLKLDGPDLGTVTQLFGLRGIPQDPFDLSGTVTLSQQSLDIDKAKLKIGGARFDLDGTLAHFPALNGSTLNLKVSGPDLDRFRDLFNLPGQAGGPFEIDGKLTISPEGKELIGIVLKTEIAEMTISGTITEPPTFAGSHLKYAGSGPDLQALGNTYNYPSLIAEPYEIRGEIEVTSDQFVTTESMHVTVGRNEVAIDGAIKFVPLQSGTDVRIQARGASLGELAGMAGLEQGIPFEPYKVDTRLEIIDAGYRLTNLSGTVGDVELTANGTISKAANLTGTQLELSVSGPELAPLVAEFEDFTAPEGPFELSGKFALETEEVRLEQVKMAAAGARANLDAVIALPIDFSDTNNSRGEFNLIVSARDLSAVVPENSFYEPDATSAALSAKGNWRRGLWVFESARIEIADATLGFRGEIDQPPDWSSTEMQVDASIASLAKLGLINGERLPDTNLEFTAHFSGTPDRFKMDDLSGTLSDGDFSGRLTLVTDTEPPEIDIDLDSNRFDLSPFLRDEDEPGENENESELVEFADIVEDQIDEPVDKGSENTLGQKPERQTDAQVAEAPPEVRPDKFLIPDWRLPMEGLEAVKADVHIDIGELQLTDIVLRDIMLHAAVEDGALTVDRIAAKGQDGDIAASLTVVPVDSGAWATLNFQGTRLYLGMMAGRTDEQVKLAPRYEADFELTGTGTTLREIASTLNGRAKLTSDGGEIENGGLTFLYGSFFEELFRSLNPFAEKESKTELICLAFVVEATDGIVDTSPGLVMQTDKMNIISKGKLDLKTEKINLNFNTAARKGIGISAGEFVNPYIRVGGSLARPRLAFDAPSAVVTTGAAVMTMGISILATAAAKRIFRKKDPCSAVLAQAEKEIAKQAEKQAKENAKQAENQAKESAEQAEKRTEQESGEP